MYREYGAYISWRRIFKNSLSAKFAGANGGSQYVWYYCDNQCNLKGTARTLDGADGECELEDGIMSRDAMTVLDDSKSLILTEDGWGDTRDGDNIDIYLLHIARIISAR